MAIRWCHLVKEDWTAPWLLWNRKLGGKCPNLPRRTSWNSGRKGAFLGLNSSLYWSCCSTIFFYTQALNSVVGERKFFPFGKIPVCLHLNNHFNIPDLYLRQRDGCWVGKCNFCGSMRKYSPVRFEMNTKFDDRCSGMWMSIENS